MAATSEASNSFSTETTTVQEDSTSIRLHGGETTDGLRPRVTFASETVDNEHLGKKKSKCCCIYHKPRRFGESSDSDSDDDCCGGGGAGGCGSGGGAGGADGKAHKHKQHQQGHSHLPGETEHCRGHTNHCYRAANDRSHEHDAGTTGAAGGSAGSGSA